MILGAKDVFDFAMGFRVVGAVLHQVDIRGPDLERFQHLVVPGSRYEDLRLGKVYENLMVDLQMTNQKLVERSRRIVMMATGADYASQLSVQMQAVYRMLTELPPSSSRATAERLTGTTDLVH